MDRRDIDHACGIGMAGFSAEQRQGLLGHEEDRLNIDAHHFVPAILRKLINWNDPIRAGIIDQDIQVIFLRLNL